MENKKGVYCTSDRMDKKELLEMLQKFNHFWEICSKSINLHQLDLLATSIIKSNAMQKENIIESLSEEEANLLEVATIIGLAKTPHQRISLLIEASKKK